MNSTKQFTVALELLSEASELRQDRYPFVTKGEQEAAERRLSVVLSRFKRLPREVQQAANEHVAMEALAA